VNLIMALEVEAAGLLSLCGEVDERELDAGSRYSYKTAVGPHLR